MVTTVVPVHGPRAFPQRDLITYRTMGVPARRQFRSVDTRTTNMARRIPRIRKADRRIAKVVQRMTQEKKYWDVNPGSTSIPDTGVQFDLSLVPQGDTDQTRDGDKLTMRALRVDGEIISADTTNVVRLIVYQYIPLVSTAPLAGIILQAVDWAAKYNHDRGGQYRILYDRTYHMNTVAKPNQGVHFTIKSFPKNMLRFEAGGTPAANHIFMLLVSDSAIATHPTIRFLSRLTFNDG